MPNNKKQDLTDTYLAYSKEIPDVLEHFQTSQQGLVEDEVSKRLLNYGKNALREQKLPGYGVLFLRQFQSPLIYILVIASFIVLALGEYIDGLVILAVLLINAVIGIIQEGKAQNILKELQKLSKGQARVIRGGIEITISDTELVPGDVVLVREGDKVPADVRLFRSNNLKTQEASLTGESEPVSKKIDRLKDHEIPTADQHNMLFKGTFVVSGHGSGVVVATGFQTVIGSISEKITSIQSEVPLKKNVDYLSKILSLIILILSLGLFGIGVLVGNSIHEMFLTAVAIAVSVIPEGLPIVITLVLATGVYRMGKQNALVKKMQAVEALGQASILAVDKTGTITKNEMMVEEVFIDQKHFCITGEGYKPEGQVLLKNSPITVANNSGLLLLGKMASFSASAQISFNKKEETWDIVGDPTEAAILVLARKLGFEKDILLEESPLVFEIPVTSQNKFHTTINKEEKTNFLVAAGAPEKILTFSKYIWTEGGIIEMSSTKQKEISKAIEVMSAKGQRIIAMGVHQGDIESVDVKNVPPLTFVGLVGMKDTLRKEVKNSIQSVREHGVRVVMITGDHKLTARAIAKEAGIYNEGDTIITGKQLHSLKEDELQKQLASVSVFARVSPEDKLAIIELFKKAGHTVAMTGDGVNDALSLVAADLGVSMGKVGTKVAQEAGDIVLLDDNISSIVSAIEEGRNIFETIKKVILYLFSTGVAEMFVLVFALFLAMPLPLLPSQIIWLNLVTDTVLVIAMAAEPKNHQQVKKLPKKHPKYIVNPLMALRIILMGSVMTIGTLWLFSFYHHLDSVKAWTISLTTLAAFQWFNVWNCRSEKDTIFSLSFFNNRWLIGAFFFSIAIHIVALYAPFMQTILRTTPLTLIEWGMVITVSLSVVIVEEIRKGIFRLFSKTGSGYVNLKTQKNYS